MGPIIRKDWLDELGLETPTTIDEWYTVLKAFKEKKGVEAPADDEAAMLLDYGYSEEGHMLFNFGIEGTSYTMKDDYPPYSDFVLRKGDKLVPCQALAMYTRASYFGPFVQDIHYMEQYYILPQQRTAMAIQIQKLAIDRYEQR